MTDCSPSPGCWESSAAATTAGFTVVSALTTAAAPEISTAIAHLRDVLGD